MINTVAQLLEKLMKESKSNERIVISMNTLSKDVTSIFSRLLLKGIQKNGGKAKGQGKHRVGKSKSLMQRAKNFRNTIQALVKGAVLIFALMGANITSAASYTQNDVRIDILGVHGSIVFFVYLEGGQQGGCELLYCPAPSENCDRLYTLALSARLSNAPLSEVRYDRNESTNFCTVTLISL